MSSPEKQYPIPFRWAAAVSVLSLIISSTAPSFRPTPTPVLETADGPIVGRVAFSRNGTKYWEFLSIPYAEPPLGPLRFQPPVPVRPWTHVKPTTHYPPVCTQYEVIARRRQMGEQDCLYLNVATPPLLPRNDSNPLLPVLVNIPGGGFVFGGSVYYSPEYIMDFNSLVVVTIQYRVGFHGFVNFAQTPDEHERFPLPRGNQGLKDQLLALKWVQRNIHRFGGDPGKITLYGQSSGGVSTHLHMLQPESRNLFQRAMILSGTGVSYYSMQLDPKKLAMNVAKKVGCPVDDPKALLECLEAADPYELEAQQICAHNPTIEQDIMVPSVETVLSESDTFLAQTPQEMIKSAELPNIPVIFGVNTGDGALRTGILDAVPEYVDEIAGNWSRNAGFFLGFNVSEQEAEAVKEFYFPGVENLATDLELFKKKLGEMVTDTQVSKGVHESAKLHASKNSAPLRLYIFDYKPTGLPGCYALFKAVRPDSWIYSDLWIVYTFLADWLDEVLGGEGAFLHRAAHSQDLFFLWPFDPLLKMLLSAKDLEFSHDYIKLVVDFVTGSEQLTYRGVPWPSINGADGETRPLPYLLIDENGEGRVVPEPFTDRIRFWQKLGV